MKLGFPYFALEFERSPYVSLPLLWLTPLSMCAHCSAHEDCQLVSGGHPSLGVILTHRKKKKKSRERIRELDRS